MSHTILVVDDSPTVVKFVSVSLKNMGYKILTASDGMDAIEKISTLPETEKVDLVITDLNMPNLDGYSLIETLRQNARHKDTPIIILSSEDGDDDQERGLQVGANSYLVKPFNSSLLTEEVTKYLDLEKKIII